MIFSSFRFITSSSTDQCVWFCVLIRSSYEAAQEWALPVQFCHLHALPLSPAFPQDCARDGQWLNFLLFVQLHNYPLQQVCLLHDSVLWLDNYLITGFCLFSFLFSIKKWIKRLFNGIFSVFQCCILLMGLFFPFCLFYFIQILGEILTAL